MILLPIVSYHHFPKVKVPGKKQSLREVGMISEEATKGDVRSHKIR